MAFAKGAKRSHPDKLARAMLATAHTRIGILLISQTLRPEQSLMPYAPPRKNQGQSGSCTAASISGGLSTALRKLGHPLPWEPSPREIYAITRAEERALVTPVGEMLPPLADGGAELADVITALATFGVCPQAVPATPDGRNYDIWTPADTAEPPNVNDEPTINQLMIAGTTLVTGAYRIDPTAANASDQAAASISAGFPLYVGFYVDSAFESLGPSDIAQPPNEHDPNGGGHAVILAGYRTNTEGQREFLLVNSWGSWCDDGCCWVSEAWLAATWEMWVLDVAVQKHEVE